MDNEGNDYTYIKEKVSANYKIATFIFTSLLATIVGVLALYQNDDLGILFIIGSSISFVFLFILFALIWNSNKILNKLPKNGN